jgi:hypothetical protein
MKVSHEEISLAGQRQRKRTRGTDDAQIENDGVRRRPTELKVRRRPSENAWELVHPRGVLERTDDLDEVQKMLDAGESDVAIDELRWLLNGCSDCVVAHKLLGELAAADGDFRLARGHFGYAYEIGISALPPGGLPGPLPYRLPANRAFFEAAKGLAWCLYELKKPKMALGVLSELLKLDPSDPLKAKEWMEKWRKETADVTRDE